jgi:hypothetical protein
MWLNGSDRAQLEFLKGQETAYDTWKRLQEKNAGEGGAGNPYTFIAETGNSEVHLNTKKNITRVLDCGVIDHLLKEDTHVVNKYEIHIAKNYYLLAYAKGDIIAVLCRWRSKEH